MNPMKNMIATMLILVTAAASAQTEPGLTGQALENETDSLSYFLGLSLGYELQSPPFDANRELILQGFTDAFRGNAPFDQQTTQTVFRNLQMAVQERESEKANLAARETLEEGNRFLEENGKREGVVTTESGLQYEVLVKGEGPMPADTSEVEVHYEGMLIDGTVFDSSYERGESISFPLNRVIKGWTEGVQLMPVGSTYKLYIPTDLGYGSGATGPIPPNSVLIFKVELLGFK